ncbi:MAG TPA: amino acid adenylation domain-containing protein, partial [Thermoanaerobaculia bacterium]|nr:amino acid adenylation domain-containing protein [Thermoanaerobaculia bacterium]
PAVELQAGAARLQHWGPETLEAVRRLARRGAATPFMVLLAGFQALLARYSGQRDFLVGVPTSGRAGSAGRFAELVGYCVNPIALRADLVGDPSAGEWLERVRRTALAAFEHQDLPFALLAERLQPEREPGRHPLFQTMLSLEQAPQSDLEGLTAFSLQMGGVRLSLGALELESVALDVPAVQLDLTLLAAELAGGLAAALHFRTDLFEAATAERLLAHFGNVLLAMAGDPERRVWDLDLLAPEERRQLLGDWNRTRTGYPREATIHRLFEHWAEEAPERIALVDLQGGLELSYGALNRRAERLARELRARGVGPETLVGVALERSAAMVEALLAVLKAGAAYVPLDPAAPRQRQEALLRELPLPWLLTESRWLPGLPAAPQTLCLDRLDDAPAAGEGVSAGAAAEPESLAYAMFTSGSTGAPKAVGVAHRSVVRLVRGTDYIDFGREQVFLQLAPAAFDAATLEIWGPLANGGRLVLFPPRAPSFSELGEVLAGQGVTTLWLTAGLFHQVVEHRLDILRPVSQLLAGGDVLSARHVNRLLAELPGCRLFNGYGPTENTTFTCVHAVREPVPSGETVPVGRPIANTRVYVLDENLAPVPVGVAGELCIGGDGLARGYLLRPELTAERFVPSPFPPGPELAEEPGARLYRTGDRARLRAGGTVEFLGRLDRQTKIRGFRVEPGEIEAALAAHPEVREAVVLVEADPTAGQSTARRLVAYVVAERAAAPAAELRGFLQQRLPEPMVPAAFVHLEALPLTANGKIDRRALAALSPAGGEAAAAYAAPRTPTEELLAGIWADLLQVERVGIHDDFFAAGGHSLLATRLVARLRAPFGCEPPLAALFENPTLAGFAAAVERLCSGSGPGLAAYPLLPVEGGRDLPLSFAQERLWFLDRLAPGRGVYNIPAGLRLRGELSVPALAAALAGIRRRHEVLRTVFADREGAPVQRIEPPAALPLPYVDLSGLAAPEEAARGLAEQEARRPFDLRRGPLLRAALLRLAADDHLLVLNLHHIVFDGGSEPVFLRELGVLYAAFAAALPSPLAELAIQYADYAVWQRAGLAQGALAPQLAYWRGQLAGASPGVALATDRPRPPVQTFRGAEEPVVLSAELVAGLRRLARQRGSTLFAAVLAGFSTLLSRYSGQEDLVVGAAVANRSRVELEPLIGFFVNTLPLRVELREDRLLDRLRDLALAAYAHQEVPFERLVEELQPHRDLSRSPLFNTLLVLRDGAAAEPRLPGLAAELVPLHSGTAKFDLTLSLAAAGDGLAGGIELNTDLFDRATVRRMAGHLATLLAGLAAGETAVAELPWLDEAERRQMLVEWNATAAPYPREMGLHELFEARAARDPQAVAVIHGRDELSGGELDRRAERLARRLRRLGVGPEVLVAVLTGRTPEMVVALLAVLKAGGAYVPLDPAYPRERVALLLADCGAPVLLTEERLAGSLPPYGGTVLLLDALDAPGEGDGGEAGGAGRAPFDPEQLAYVIYTSGSTGVPKGVAIRHGSAVARVWWALSAYPPESLRGVLAATSICFDLSVFEIFVPLAGGGALILAENALALPSLPAAGRVTLVNTVPSAMAELARVLPASVSTVNLAGEPLRRELAEQLYARPGVAAVHDLYGPSEDTTYSTGALVARGAQGEPTIGRPLPNTRVYVLDAGLEPVPIGVPGALWIGGAGLARGYLRRPGLTAERFRPDPFATPAADPGGGRLYETGDLARWRLGGELEFLGRADQQVKVRGYRIELGEVEALLAALPGVEEAAVAALGREADRHLVAYVVVAPESAFSPEDLRASLRRRLPEPMVPAVWMRLAKLPRTPNGKLDRRRLPAPEAARLAAAACTAPRTPVEELLADLWAELLGIERVGVDDDFFSLGGHSLLAARAAARLGAAFGVDLPLTALFQSPTVAGLASLVERALAGQAGFAGAGEEAVLAAPRLTPAPEGAEIPLSFAQERLWFLDQLEPGGATYNLPAALRLRGALDAGALAAALGEVIARHGGLRTVFATVAGRPVQVVRPAAPAPLHVIDLQSLPDAEPAARQLATAEARRPFDLGRGPLLRACLLRLAPADHLLLLNLHHAVADGWSLGVLFGELSALYTAGRQGVASPLPALPVQYADYAVWQRRWLAGPVLERLIGHWRRQLAGAPAVLELPADRPRPPLQSFRGAASPVVLPPDLVSALRDVARGHGATLFMTLLAGFAALLRRYSGQEEVVVGATMANRERVELEGLIGFFVNALPLRIDLAGDPPPALLMERVRATALSAYAHRDLPFEKLVQELAPQRDLSRSPWFQVLFAFEEGQAPILRLPGIEPELVPVHNGTAKFDLTLSLAGGEGGLTGGLEWNADLFDAVTALRLAGHLRALWTAMARTPGAPLEDCPLLTAAEAWQVLGEWNDTRAGAPRVAALHQLFEEQARRTPEAVALVHGTERLRYRDLDAQAGAVARRLRRLGTAVEEPVGILARRSPAMVAALLGVLEAGGAYLPLDPAYPPERLAFLLADGGVRTVLATGDLAPLLAASGLEVVRLETLVEEEAAAAGPPPQTAAHCGPEQLAYLIYTSGSTGTPKGVAIRHGSAVARVEWAAARYGAGELAGVLASTSITFDLSVFELFVPLSLGGTVILADDALALASLPAAPEVTLINTVPSAMEALVQAAAVPGSVRVVNLAGEALRRDLVEQIYALPGIEAAYNLYGPSEDTTYSTGALVPRGGGTPAI